MTNTKVEELWKVGDVLQIKPDHGMFGGCFLIVTERLSSGAQGFINVPGESGGSAFLRVAFKDAERIGKAAWSPEKGYGAGGEVNEISNRGS